jgi:hypothetical protein
MDEPSQYDALAHAVPAAQSVPAAAAVAAGQVVDEPVQ